MRLIAADEMFSGPRTRLRLVRMDDCNTTYLGWLADPQVNRYLETRWNEQTLDSIRSFVAAQLIASDSYLFAILAEDGVHIGNLKIGPINPRHTYADISYFIGERSRWGRGHASEAIILATRLGFERLGLHRLQAGLYAGNVASGRALVKAGYLYEGLQRRQLCGPEGWEDHLWYGQLADEWQTRLASQGKPA